MVSLQLGPESWESLSSCARASTTPDKPAGEEAPEETICKVDVTSVRFTPSMQPFWVDIFKGYLFHGTNTENMCFLTLYANTGQSREQAANSVLDVQTGTFDRCVTYCSQGWNPALPAAQSQPSLANIITYNVYPTSGNRKSLASYIPISGTFYHKLFHLTDSAGITGDPFHTCFFSSFSPYLSLLFS